MNDVPAFKKYFPTPDDLSADQRAFYEALASSLSGGVHPPVDGNISYLFLFVYALVAKLQNGQLPLLRQTLLSLAEAYHYEAKFPEYCRQWAYETLLAEGRYSEYLTLTEPENPFVTRTHLANQRCNVLYKVRHQPGGTDLAQLFGIRVTKATRRYSGAFRDALDASVSRHQRANGSFLTKMMRDREVSGDYGSRLMSGIPYAEAKFAVASHCFYTHTESAEILASLSREAENEVRKAAGMPLVGEGWVSETLLYQAIRTAFPETRVIQHGRPSWLGRQHLDIWLPDWSVALEYHGKQHFESVEYFGGEAALESTRERDARKVQLCREAGVTLIVVTEADPHDTAIGLVRTARNAIHRARAV